MTDQLVAALLPVLAERRRPSFNVFDVMHHGTHEKQLSNVFAWLLDSRATHDLGEVFQTIFVEAINKIRTGGPALLPGSYSVSSEVNVAGRDGPMDIADLVLEDDDTVVVVENYYTSDGHGHSYDNYLGFGEQKEKNAVVVMLCERHNAALLSDGWQHAVVITYADLISPLARHIESDAKYQRDRPAQVAFIRHLKDRFVKGQDMNDVDMARFIDAMCTSGEARRYQAQSVEGAAVSFADDLRERAKAQFGEGRAWLQRVKSALRNYSAEVLVPQLAEVLAAGEVLGVSARYAGIYQWTINFELASHDGGSEAPLQLKFGPSAWFAIKRDDTWKSVVDDPDYTCLFITRYGMREIRQSKVTIREVLDGIDRNDTRLRDEIVSLLATGS